MDSDFLDRTRLLLGEQAVKKLRRAHVAVFGVGGVGSWCAEALARTGVGHITIVDSDDVATSNINRQLIALHSTVGRPKVEVMKARMEDINPDISVEALHRVFTPQDAAVWDFSRYDAVIDAIDSIPAKMALIMAVTATPSTRLFSSMGAALKSDPTQVQVAEFNKVYGCPLARTLRQRFKRAGIHPARKFKCVFSPQLLENKAAVSAEDTPNGAKRVNGTLVYATAVFGLVLAQLAVDRICTQT